MRIWIFEKMKQGTKLNWKFALLTFLIAILLGTLLSLNHYGCLIYNHFCSIQAWNLPKCCWDQVDHILGVLTYFWIFFTPFYALIIHLKNKKWIKDKCFLGIFWFIIILVSFFPITVELTYELIIKECFNCITLLYDFIGLAIAWFSVSLLKSRFWKNA